MRLIAPTEFDFQFSRNGASNELAVKGDVTPVHFDVIATNNLDLWAANILIVDGSQRPNLFGGLPALTNGLLVKVLDADLVEVTDFLDGETIKTNAEFSLLTGIDNHITAAAGDDVLEIHWHFGQDLAAPLHLPVGYRLRVTVQDDLQLITSFRIMWHGLT